MTNTRLPPGIHANVPERIYHGDCAVEISASSGVLRTAFQQSLAHARNKHPRLNPTAAPDDPTDSQAAGTILHALILGTPAPFVALPFDSFRTDKAKFARDAAYADYKIPILAHKLDDLRAIADRTRTHIAAKYPKIHAAIHDPESLKEATVIGRVNGVLCRARYDLLPPKHYGFTVDLKFTGLTAEPDAWSRKTIHDYMFQADLYPRLVHATRGDAPEFRFLVIETGAVAASTLHAMAPSLAEIARGRVNTALSKWQRALETDHWPDYPGLVHYAEATSWLIGEDEARAEADRFVEELA